MSSPAEENKLVSTLMGLFTGLNQGGKNNSNSEQQTKPLL